MNDFKHIYLTISCLICLCFSQAIEAQQVVSGRITDATDGTPVPGVHVFIANTSIGTTSDESGNYSFTVPGMGSFEIVVSHVSYQAVSYKIDMPQPSHRHDVALAENELDEIIVNAKKTYRNRDVDLFWRTILKEKPSRNGMQVVNPEKVYFYLNSDNVLKAFAYDPIEIINHQMGYRILYVLQSFEYDYRNNEFTYYGKPYFEELTPRNSRERDRWEKKRREVYDVSMIRFMRALYNEQIREEGFLLVNRNEFEINSMLREGSQNEQSDPIDPTLKFSNQSFGSFGGSGDRYIYSGSPARESYREALSEANVNRIFDESVKNAYEIISMENGYTFSKETLQSGQNIATITIDDPLLLICYAQPVTDEMARDIYRHINPKYPVMELLPQQITIFPDGTYSGTMKMSEHQNSIVGLSATLPVEYASSFSDLAQSAPKQETSSVIDRAEANITTQLEGYVQEKIHVHTDRDFYVPGERIWFKAYVTDAYSHLFPTYSEYVYAELISPTNTLVNRVMITQTEGMFYGYLPISEIVPEGNYTLRAYTRYMENLGDDYFFKKNIRIGNITGENRGLLENPDKDFDVSFFPEGGNLPAGVLHKVAFKALNQSGYPEPVTGYLIDENGAEISAVQTYHAGMGVFVYRPEIEKKYRFKCVSENGLEKLFELPQPHAGAYSLTASMQNNRFLIGVQKSVNAADIPCYLLVHSRGTALYFSAWDHGRQAVALMEKDLPAGVIQAVLFDGQMNPLSERLIFSKNDTTVKVEFHTDRDRYQSRDKVVSTLSFPDSLFYSHTGHFSIAVTDDKDMEVDGSTTILSSLLLSSELKGYIENPAYYLRDPVAMDLLMMTHGWRRYNIPEVVKGHLESPQIPFQQFQTFSGQVKTLTSNRPVPDSEILTMMRGEGGGYSVTSTDVNGLFAVREILFPDSTFFFIQALDRNGRDNVRLEMIPESFPDLAYAPQSPFPAIPIKVAEAKEEPDIDTFIEKAEQHVKFEEDIWTLNLNELVVTAPRIARRDAASNQRWTNLGADATITSETIEKTSLPLVSDYVKQLPGVQVNPNGTINIRNGTSITQSTLPLVLIDGFSVGWDDLTLAILIDMPDNLIKQSSPLEQVPVSNIESIDVFAGPSASMFGARGANGVINITTKSGRTLLPDTDEEKPNQIVYSPSGYQKPIAFYAPRYETLEAKRSPVPDYRTTIFWKPDAVIADNEDAVTFEFYTSDFKTTYSVVIEGLTNDGKIVRQVEKIQVE